MGKQPVKLKAVVYALSPFQQKVMSGLWKDLPMKITHKITDNWINATLLHGPLVGTYSFLVGAVALEAFKWLVHIGLVLRDFGCGVL